MVKLIANRVLALVFVLLALTALLFVLQNFSPVNPVRVLLGPQASEAAQQATAARLGLDRPIWEQYVSYLANVARGDFGTSTRTNASVGADLMMRLPATVELLVTSMLIMIVLAVVMAYTGAARWKIGGLVRGALTALGSAPAFLLGLLAILLFSNQLGVLPGNGRTSFGPAANGYTGFVTLDALLMGRFDIWWDAVLHLVLPATCIALTSAVAVGRVLRGGLLDSFSVPYTRTAFAKGLTRSEVIVRHSFRNSLNPTLSMLGLQFGVLIASDIVVEQVFSWPGMGSYLAQAIPANDFPAIAAITLLLGIGFVLVNLCVDIAQILVDPRIRA